MQIDYDKLYYFTEKFGRKQRSFRASPEDALTLEVSQSLQRAEYHPKEAVTFRHQMGNNIAEVIWTGYVACVLVSTKFRDLLERERFTGWSTYPIVLYGEDSKELQGYVGLSILGRAGVVDFTRSRIASRGPIYEGGPKWKNHLGLFFKDDLWDGSDIFMVEGRSSTFVTERVKQAVAEFNIPNVQFERLSEYEEQVSKFEPSARLIR